MRRPSSGNTGVGRGGRNQYDGTEVHSERHNREPNVLRLTLGAMLVCHVWLFDPNRGTGVCLAIQGMADDAA